jgi:NADH-quinone oxidoreductase subunit G
VDHNENVIYRLKPRYNPGVNDWWMCDMGRFGWKYAQAGERVAGPLMRRGESVEPLDWAAVAGAVRFRLQEVARERGAETIAVVLSPFMCCEEAWLLASTVRKMVPGATLVCGPVPLEEQDGCFPVGAADDKVKFTISRERCPNRRGIERIIEGLGGATLSFADFSSAAAEGKFAGAWISGGYPIDWVDKDFAKAAEKIDFVVLHDLFPTKLCATAEIILPSCPFSERSGTFMNIAGKIQPFEPAVNPPTGYRRDGQVLYDLAEMTGLYQPGKVRRLMAETMPEFADVGWPPPVPEHASVVQSAITVDRTGRWELDLAV